MPPFSAFTTSRPQFQYTFTQADSHITTPEANHTTTPQYTVENVYKCLDYSETVLYYAGYALALSILVLIILLVKNESLKAVLRSLLPRIIQWGREVLSRGQEGIPQGNQAAN